MQPLHEEAQRPTGSPPTPALGASRVWKRWVPVPLSWSGSCHVRLCSLLPASSCLGPRWVLDLAFETPTPTPIQCQGCPPHHPCHSAHARGQCLHPQKGRGVPSFLEFPFPLRDILVGERAGAWRERKAGLKEHTQPEWGTLYQLFS